MKRFFVRMITVAAALSLCVSVMLPAMTAGAVSYAGSGTMADPYLVTNAEQLQGIRENLSAHYKLANTIDLSGVDFKPIGRLDNPFTGSFVCELNADNTPKYIIKNLSMSIAATDYSVEKKNKWEGAMFGAAQGSTFSGIYVLDVNISNENFGANTGAVIYGDYKPGMNEMSSAALVGHAFSCSISNCASSGNIDTKSSFSGGLIGSSESSTIQNCYSTATVKSAALFSIGGLMGCTRADMVDMCYATGNVSGGDRAVGALIGSVYGSTITNSYATGNVAAPAEAVTNFASDRESGTSTYKNCFATGTITTNCETEEGASTVTNCWTLSGTKSFMKDFKQGSAAEIVAAFANLSGWDTTGTYPALTGIGVVADSAAYQPGAVDATTTPETPSTNTTTQPGQTTTTTPETQAPTMSVDEIIEKINQLPDADEITIDDKDTVKEIWSAYEALSVSQKDEFDSTAFASLSQVRYQLSLFMVSDIVNALKELPEDTADYTKDDVELVLALYEDYLFLDDTVKNEFQPEYLEILETAYEYAKNYSGSSAAAISSGLTTTEWIIVIVSIVIILLTVAFYTFAAIIYTKKAKCLGSEEIEVDSDDIEEE